MEGFTRGPSRARRFELAYRAVYHVLQRHALPGDRRRHRPAAGEARARGRLSRPNRLAADRCTSTPATSARRSRWSGASSGSSRSYEAVVAPSGSCVGMVRELYPMAAKLAGDDRLAGEVEELAPKVFELSEFLVKKLGVTDVGAYYPHRVTYHPTCHSLRMIGVGDAPLETPAGRSWHRLGRASGGGGVLRFRRDLRRQERRHLGGDAFG